ncbi:sporulation protein [Kitasatospora sp. LaBMicrA B282]|uniref:sporulation protein n=1 Tax=Kitasatospora sp. LaBMicrA B282 TaxID=3420949 RepID=UPI003D14ED95
MAKSQGRDKTPNVALSRLVAESGASRKSLALRLRNLCEQAGYERKYTHASWSNWMTKGMIPDPPAPELITRLLSERLGRRITLADIGMAAPSTAHADTGLAFPRDRGQAVTAAAEFWSTVDRRTVIAGAAAFGITHFTTPTARWLINPADPVETTLGGRRVGQADIDELRETAEEARRWDARYGGGNWKLSSVNACLAQRASPLLSGTYSEPIGRQLFAVTAELARLAGWSAFDIGQHGLAQRHFIQALRMAKAGGDAETGCYVLTTMALQALIRGFPSEAIDMAQGAYTHAKHAAAPRVLSFTKLAEARAHGKAGDAAAASRALREAEDLMSAIRDDGRDPQWLEYYSFPRLASDATEIHRDLKQSKAALSWSTQADAMPSGQYTRATGIRLAVTASAHLQLGRLDQGLAVGQRALSILGGVESARAQDYLRNVVTSLQPWAKEAAASTFIRQSRTVLGHTA